MTINGLSTTQQASKEPFSCSTAGRCRGWASRLVLVGGIDALTRRARHVVTGFLDEPAMFLIELLVVLVALEAEELALLDANHVVVAGVTSTVTAFRIRCHHLIWATAYTEKTIHLYSGQRTWD